MPLSVSYILQFSAQCLYLTFALCFVLGGALATNSPTSKDFVGHGETLSLDFWKMAYALRWRNHARCNLSRLILGHEIRRNTSAGSDSK
jgi:hypothetical protein